MKKLLILSTVFWSLGLFAQNYDSIGIDNNPIANKHEVELLNTLLEDERSDFDFTNKKIAFITGPACRSIVSKSEYFKDLVAPWIAKGDKPHIFMYKLSEEEKKNSGGYDVIVLSWVKVFSPKSRIFIIKQLSIENKKSMTEQSKNLNMKLYDKIKILLKDNKLDDAIALAEAELLKKPKSDFHWIYQKDFLHLTNKLFTFIDSNFQDKNRLEQTKAFYSELNGFSINYDKWFLDITAFDEKGNFYDEKSDWLCDGFWGSNNPEYFELKGLRKLRKAFKTYNKKEGFKNEILKETKDITDLIVILRLQQLFEKAIQIGKDNNKEWALKPWGITAHGYNLIYVIEK